jgi:hypothetical protein
MIVGPKTITTSALERDVIEEALLRLIKDDERKLKTAKSEAKIDALELRVAYSKDLLTRLWSA